MGPLAVSTSGPWTAAGKALTQAGAALGLPRGVVALLASFIAP
jgi:hypothetical protein